MMGLQIHVNRSQPHPKTGAGRLDVAPFVPALVARWMTSEPGVMHRRTRGTLVRVQRPADPAPAIEMAGTLGGDLLKFVGDDLLFFFDGRRHEERALRVTDALPPGARAASGTVDLFLTGCAHRELFVCGEAVAELMDGVAVGGRRGPTRRVAAKIAADIAQLRRCVPGIIRTNGVANGKHETAIAAMHLANLDELIEDAGPDVAVRHLSDLTNRIDRSFAEHDISFISSDIAAGGPLIVCATGIVRSRANDVQRLLRALCELVDYPSAIDLRIGVDRGSVDVRHEGTATRRTMTLRGKAFANASRLSSEAERSEIAMTPRVVTKTPALRGLATKVGGMYRLAKPPRPDRGVVNMLLNLGTLAYEHDDHRAATHYFQEALELSRRGNAKRDEALLLHRLAETALASHDPELAMVRCDQALELLRELDDAQAHAAAMMTLGHAREADGDVASAHACYRHAAEILASSTAPRAAGPSSDG